MKSLKWHDQSTGQSKITVLEIHDSALGSRIKWEKNPPRNLRGPARKFTSYFTRMIHNSLWKRSGEKNQQDHGTIWLPLHHHSQPNVLQLTTDNSYKNSIGTAQVEIQSEIGTAQTVPDESDLWSDRPRPKWPLIRLSCAWNSVSAPSALKATSN